MHFSAALSEQARCRLYACGCGPSLPRARCFSKYNKHKHTSYSTASALLCNACMSACPAPRLVHSLYSLCFPRFGRHISACQHRCMQQQAACSSPLHAAQAHAAFAPAQAGSGRLHCCPVCMPALHTPFVSYQNGVVLFLAKLSSRFFC